MGFLVFLWQFWKLIIVVTQVGGRGFGDGLLIAYAMGW